MRCKFCGHALNETTNFCSNCGENLQLERLNVRTILSTFFNEFLDYDNKLYKTFVHLFTQPQTVINTYINGSRKTYVNVITYFSISLTLAALQIFVIKNFYPELFEMVHLGPQSTIPNPEYQFNLELYDYQGLIAIVFTPFTAVISRIAFIDNKKYNLAEHIIITVYPSAQIFIIWSFFTIVIILFKINYLIASAFIYVPLFLYMWYIFKKLYEISLIQSFARTLIYFGLTTIFYFVVFAILGVLLVLYMARSGHINIWLYEL